MKIGRNFTNLLETMYLSAEEKEALRKGSLSVPDMDATVQIKSKRNIIFQVEMAKEIGIDHVELDGGVPNPFLNMTADEVERARKKSEELGITISLHLPYTFVAESIVSFQPEERKIAVDLLKRYIDFAHRLGCLAVNLHPGSVPFYQAAGLYLKIVQDGLRESLLDLARYCAGKKIIFHMENNTYFDNIYKEVDEIVELLKDLKKEGADIKFCFDIGHWFTRAFKNFGLEIPNPPEDIFLKIPGEFLWEVHLNDYIAEKNKFHPPLHYEAGPLKKANLVKLAGYFRKQGVKLIVVETAVRDVEELLNSKALLLEESAYLREVFK
ncbi:MAG TPA: sugar phosphate isomerase/epimerase family protein [bacterium]|nr:sugar phosphate isomerase/epimerase family protein [bacterium]